MAEAHELASVWRRAFRPLDDHRLIFVDATEVASFPPQPSHQVTRPLRPKLEAVLVWRHVAAEATRAALRVPPLGRRAADRLDRVISW